MKENITIQAALNRGQLIVNLPVAIIMMSIMISFFCLGVKGICPIWVVVIGFVLGFSLAWLWWSFMVTRWMLWAFPKVDHVQELRQAAVDVSLIWPKGHFFEKTMIISAAQQAQLDQLDAKRSIPTPKLPKTYRTDDTIPMETVIYYSKINLIFTVLINSSIYIIIIICLFIDKPKLEFKSFVVYLGVALFLWGIIDTFKQLLNINKPQLIINNEGIWSAAYADEGVHIWSDIREEIVEKQYIKRWCASFFYYYENQRILQERLEKYKESLPQLAKIPKIELDELIEKFQKMEYIHLTWKKYGLSDDDLENLAMQLDNDDNCGKLVELDITSYNISIEQLQYLLEIYRGRHLQAQKAKKNL